MGLFLRANVFRPKRAGRYPVILAQGVLRKDAHFERRIPRAMGQTLTITRTLRNDSTGQSLRWETVDPERWSLMDTSCSRRCPRHAPKIAGLSRPPEIAARNPGLLSLD